MPRQSNDDDEKRHDFNQSPARLMGTKKKRIPSHIQYPSHSKGLAHFGRPTAGLCLRPPAGHKPSKTQHNQCPRHPKHPAWRGPRRFFQGHVPHRRYARTRRQTSNGQSKKIKRTKGQARKKKVPVHGWKKRFLVNMPKAKTTATMP